MIDNENCKDCFYYRKLYMDAYWCCNYIFIENRKRPCEPGSGCTVKIPVSVFGKEMKNGQSDV